MSDGHVSEHNDDTPEGEVVESDLQELPQPEAQDDNFGVQSPSSAMTEADVMERRENGEPSSLDDVPEPEGEVDEEHHDKLYRAARDVIAGKYGTGQERRLKLELEGLDPNEVEEAVTRLRNPDRRS